MKNITKIILAFLLVAIAITGLNITTFAKEGDFPPRPVPPRLVNDMAHFMSDDEVAALEQKLVAFSDSTSNQVAIVTIENVGEYEIADYTLELFNKWQIGTKENKNGVLILASKENRKMWITTGYGLEGALPDGLVGEIIRKEMVPYFKKGRFYDGFDHATDAVMSATRGEYKGEGRSEGKRNKSIPAFAILIIILVLIFFIRRGGSGGRGGGGGYMGPGGWIAANIIGSMIGSSLSNRGSGGWGGGSSGGGGFGGFGGGSSGGGGAGGSW